MHAERPGGPISIAPENAAGRGVYEVIFSREDEDFGIKFVGKAVLHGFLVAKRAGVDRLGRHSVALHASESQWSETTVAQLRELAHSVAGCGATDGPSEREPKLGSVLSAYDPDRLDHRAVKIAGKRVYLGGCDTRLARALHLLASPPGRTRGWRELFERVWGSEEVSEKQARRRVAQVVNRLREALDDNGAGAHVLITTDTADDGELAYVMTRR